ncbi:hypothetical protein [Lentzea sp.]|uniref:hypothetical protein n=1 Tax=Lentzea sp. TaxID=56099 RepID=UPI002C97F6D3|nr:hypothetical protein [Lentzea sp.]HUQ58507.1 hypothetical protein [Lentzea sp.]
MRNVLVMDHFHRIEYRRRKPGGALDLELVEEVVDHGWYIKKGEEWRRRYTLECAYDFLARTETKAGTFAISVWRDGDRVCTVGMEWNPTKG